jgi:DNA-binding transcriptional LysR family regulator
MLSFRQLKSLVALSEYGNLKDAAQALGVSRQTAASNIKTIEAHYDKVLFEKTGHQITPSPPLKALLPLVKQACKILVETEEALEQARSLEKATFAIGIGEPVIGVELISAFLEKYPRVTLQATEGNAPALLRGLHDRTLDIAILALTELDDKLTSVLLRKDSLCACVPIGHELAVRETIEIEELQYHKLIIGSAGTTLRAITGRAFFQAHCRLNTYIEFDEWDPIIEATLQGMGVGIIQDNLVVGDSRLHSLRLQGGDTSVYQYIVFPPENDNLATVRAFLEICQSDPAYNHMDGRRISGQTETL